MKQQCKTISCMAGLAIGFAIGISAPAHADITISYHMLFHGSVHSRACLPGLANADNATSDTGLLALAPVAYGVGVQDFAVVLKDCSLAPQALASAWFYGGAGSAVVQGQLVQRAADGAIWQHQLVSAEREQPLAVGLSAASVPANSTAMMTVTDRSRLAYRVRYRQHQTGNSANNPANTPASNPTRTDSHAVVGDVTYVMYYQ